MNAIVETSELKPLEALKKGDKNALFRFLWRIKEHRTGPPSYPEFDEEIVSQLMYDVKLMFDSTRT